MWMLLLKLCEEHHQPWSDFFAGQNAVSCKCFSITWRIQSVGLCYSSTVFQVTYPHYKSSRLSPDNLKKEISWKTEQNVAWNSALLLVYAHRNLHWSSLEMLQFSLVCNHSQIKFAHGFSVMRETRNGKLAPPSISVVVSKQHISEIMLVVSLFSENTCLVFEVNLPRETIWQIKFKHRLFTYLSWTVLCEVGTLHNEESVMPLVLKHA